MKRERIVFKKEIDKKRADPKIIIQQYYSLLLETVLIDTFSVASVQDS